MEGMAHHGAMHDTIAAAINAAIEKQASMSKEVACSVKPCVDMT